MDSQDQRKTSPSGHESHGVYVCHKCGWPFPKPHPSAKHRRAHKRICGTIEGYKLTDTEEHSPLAVSDDEHPDDDGTPSPKIEKTITKEFGSGGVGEKSHKSEDEMFSDAVTEFSDSGYSPGIEKLLEGVKELDKNVEKVVEGNQNASQSLKVDATADNGKALNSSMESSQMYNPEVFDGGNTTPYEDTRSEEIGVGSSLPCELSPVQSETPTDAPKENNVDDKAMQPSMAPPVQERDVKRNEEENVDRSLSDVADPPSKTAGDASLVESKLQETAFKTPDPLSVGVGVVEESKQEQSDGSGPKMSEHDLPPEVDSADQMDASTNSFQIKPNSTKDKDDINSDGDSVEVCDTKREGRGEFHMFSVANDLPVIDNPDMIEDFKDHKKVKSSLHVSLDSAEVSSSVKDDNENIVYEESLSSSRSGKVGKSIHGSVDVNALSENLQQDGSGDELLIKVPAEREADTSDLKVASNQELGSHGLESPSFTTRSKTQEIQTKSSIEGLQPHSSDYESLQDTPAEYTTKDPSDVIPVLISFYSCNDNTSNFSGFDDADDSKMDNDEKYDAAGNEGEGVVNKEFLDSPEKISASKVDPNAKLLGEDDTRDYGKARTEISDVNRNETTEAAALGEKYAVTEETTGELACHLSESSYLDRVPDSTEVVTDMSHMTIMTETRTDLPNSPYQDSNEAIKELEINNDREVLPECVGAVDMHDESNHTGDGEVTEKISENPILTGPGPVDSESAIKSSAAVEDNHNSDGGMGVCGVSSEPMQQDGGDKLTKLHSAVDISIDSGSQTDSLEGNWGSVSVLSTQSDVPAVVDPEAVPSTDSRTPEKSKKAELQKPKSAAEVLHSVKSDVFEAPSFMTLVESGGGVDPKATSSEIQLFQNSQQPKPEALQAGWFPSLTNVVNESQGRKKNEERIAKVTNWKQHTPLKNLLSEANVEAKQKSHTPKQTPTVVQQDGNVPVATVNSILGSEAPADQAAKKVIGKEWNSPISYPTDKNKEKKKVKGKPYWVPFVCCSSVN